MQMKMSRERELSSITLDPHISRVFAARNINTVKERIHNLQFPYYLSWLDTLCKTELELIELLDVPMSMISKSIAQISCQASPPCQTALSLMKERIINDPHHGHFKTWLRGLDDALCGGIPLGSVTEIVGPAGIGKTQLCLKLSVLAAMQKNQGRLDGNVIYIDTENKFSSVRMIEIAKCSFPNIFCNESIIQQLAARVWVLHLSSLAELTESLQNIEASISQHPVKLLIIDSIAGLLSSEYGQDQAARRYDTVGRQASILKSFAEFSRMPIIVTNQVRVQNMQDGRMVYRFEGRRKNDPVDSEIHDQHLTAALGTVWAHAVNIRLILESHAGQRFLKISKSPISQNLAFPYTISASGLSLSSNEAMELTGQDISSIHVSGYEDILGNDDR